jgi:hypothetical protein
MKFWHLLLLTSVFIGCNSPKNNSSSTADFSIKNNHTDPDTHLKQLFYNWQQQQIAAGEYLPNDSCNIVWYVEHRKRTGQEPDSEIGFPDSTDLKFTYADLNEDGLTDQMVTFNPALCSGGNALMWAQIIVLTLSADNSYTTQEFDVDNPINTINADTSGFYHIDSIAPGRFFATYFEFRDDDARCCPGIQKRAVISYPEKRLVDMGENIAE